MDKMCRARIILRQVVSLDLAKGITLPNETNFQVPDMRLIDVTSEWKATITRNARKATAGDAPGPAWDLLSLHADGDLQLALHFREDQLKLIRFWPGFWEIWFGTYDPTDYKKLGEAN
ncbi:hypothetical protein [Tsuneonella sp. HG222]